MQISQIWRKFLKLPNLKNISKNRISIIIQHPTKSQILKFPKKKIKNPVLYPKNIRNI